MNPKRSRRNTLNNHPHPQIRNHPHRLTRCTSTTSNSEPNIHHEHATHAHPDVSSSRPP